MPSMNTKNAEILENGSGKSTSTVKNAYVPAGSDNAPAWMLHAALAASKASGKVAAGCDAEDGTDVLVALQCMRAFENIRSVAELRALDSRNALAPLEDAANILIDTATHRSASSRDTPADLEQLRFYAGIARAMAGSFTEAGIVVKPSVLVLFRNKTMLQLAGLLCLSSHERQKAEGLSVVAEQFRIALQDMDQATRPELSTRVSEAMKLAARAASIADTTDRTLLPFITVGLLQYARHLARRHRLELKQAQNHLDDAVQMYQRALRRNGAIRARTTTDGRQ